MSFISPQFTNAGKKLQARALSGDAQITFTQMGLGDGELATQSISALTDLINPIKKIDISDLRVINPDQVQLKAVFQNVGMVGFFWREVGLFAADPDNPDDRTKDILYCYQNAQDLAEYIPSGDSQLVDKILNMSVVVADATQVKISFFSESYALKEDLDAHKTDPNAHGNLFAKSVNGTNVSDNNNIELNTLRDKYQADNAKHSAIFGGEAYGKGAGLSAYGAKHAKYPGYFNLYAMTNEKKKAELVGTPAGSLTWQGHEVITAKGGTLKGRLTFSLNDAIYRNDDTSYLHLCGGNVFGKSASLILNGGQNLDGSSSYGGFELSATNGEDMTNLVGQSTGALTWGGKNLVRSVNGVNADAEGNVNVIADYKNTDSGYIQFSNGLIFAWSTPNISKGTDILVVNKPKPFTSLVAYVTDATASRAGALYNHAWVSGESTNTTDTFKSSTSAGDGFVIFWIGKV